MTEERIRELARKAHLTPADVCAGIIRTAIAETREECARVCEKLSTRGAYAGRGTTAASFYGRERGITQCAAAIRAKG